MKHLLSRFALVLAAATSASGAWALTTKTCGEFTYPAFPNVFNNQIRQCPVGSGVVQSIASLTRMTTIDESASARFVYRYSVEIITGPAPLSQPRAAALLLKSNGSTVVSAAGTLCPEAVDITNVGGPGNQQTCRIVRQTSGAMVKTRVIHQTL